MIVFVSEHTGSDNDEETGPYDVGGVTVPTSCPQRDIFLAH